MRILRIAKARLDRIGITVQPVEQLLAVGRDDIELRAMHVTVNETGDDELAGQLGQLHIFGQSGQKARSITSLGDVAILDNQHTVLKVLISRCERSLTRIGKAMQD